jgi:hypothetical protein
MTVSQLQRGRALTSTESRRDTHKIRVPVELQWGRARASAELLWNLTNTTGAAMLQWGRVQTRRNRCERSKVAQQISASTEPRSDEHGIEARCRRSRGRSLTGFNGTALRRAGNLCDRCRLACYGVPASMGRARMSAESSTASTKLGMPSALQWGRARMSAESG